MDSKLLVTVIFDNGGGTTVKIAADGHSGSKPWAYYFAPGEETEAAEVALQFVIDGCSCGYDTGDSDALALDPTLRQIAAGQYATRSLLGLWDADPATAWGYNEQHFIEALQCLRRDNFAEMVRDWVADNAPDYDDLVIDDPEIVDGRVVAYATDTENKHYELSDIDGNIYINRI